MQEILSAGESFPSQVPDPSGNRKGGAKVDFGNWFCLIHTQRGTWTCQANPIMNDSNPILPILFQHTHALK